MLTPAFPQYFLLLASIANIAKQISLACYLATGVSFSVSAFLLNVLEKDLDGIRNYLYFVSLFYVFFVFCPIKLTDGQEYTFNIVMLIKLYVFKW